MKKEKTALRDALEALLDEKLPPAQVKSLKDGGYLLKKPTRKAALAISIYEKAVSGDLSAVKELRSILSSETAGGTCGKAVLIIDDTGN
ncbi:MAG: hypothetical protein IKZ59_03610 [Clostridia bacterium]|nr:hypothetical protein [Clostridia bacterium]